MTIQNSHSGWQANLKFRSENGEKNKRTFNGGKNCAIAMLHSNGTLHSMKFFVTSKWCSCSFWVETSLSNREVKHEKCWKILIKLAPFGVHTSCKYAFAYALLIICYISPRIVAKLWEGKQKNCKIQQMSDWKWISNTLIRSFENEHWK